MKRWMTRKRRMVEGIRQDVEGFVYRGLPQCGVGGVMQRSTTKMTKTTQRMKKRTRRLPAQTTHNRASATTSSTATSHASPPHPHRQTTPRTATRVPTASNPPVDWGNTSPKCLYANRVHRCKWCTVSDTRCETHAHNAAGRFRDRDCGVRVGAIGGEGGRGRAIGGGGR